MARVIVGTAGHIDHGKSALVRALTGTDPDRLPEEKNRGITIDLGYAFLAGVAAVIDVPGHERFIRNMVAGAATVDYALLVVAADDGVMPQTTEHLHILRLLGLRAGAIVITKIDKAEPEWLELVEEQARAAAQSTFLADAPLFRVDSLSGKGIAELREFLIETLSKLPSRLDSGGLRLPVDRVFLMKGRGTVITGSMLGGSVRKDQRLVALPGGHDVRVKHLESEGREADVLESGQRAALNLVGDTERLERGQTLTHAGELLSSTRLNLVIELLPGVPPLKERQRIRFLIATQEVIGRVLMIGEAGANRVATHLILEEPVVAVWGDHFVIRRYSPLETLGGGTVLEADAPPLRARQLEIERSSAAALDCDSLPEAVFAMLRFRGRHGLPLQRLAALVGVSSERLKQILAGEGTKTRVHAFGEYLLLDEHRQSIAELVSDQLKTLHAKQPGSSGFAPAELRQGELLAIPESLFQLLLNAFAEEHLIAREGGLLRLPDKRIELTPAQQALIAQIRPILENDGFTPSSAAVLSERLSRSKTDVEKVLVLMERLGAARRLGVDLFFDAKAFDSAVQQVIVTLRGGKELSVSEASQLLNSSRKYVVPLLEYLDGKGITQRQGNVRVAGRNFTSVDA